MNDDNIFAAGEDHGSSRTLDADPFQWTHREQAGPDGSVGIPDLVAYYFRDILRLLSRSWELVIANLGTVGIGIVIMFAIGILGQVVNFAISMGTVLIEDEAVRTVVQLVGQQGAAFLFFLAQLYFQLGIIKAVVEIDRGNEVELDTIWSQGGAWMQAVAVTLALGFAYLVALGAFGGVGAGLGYGLVQGVGFETGLLILLVIGTLVTFVVLVIVMIIGLGLSMMYQALVDERAAWLGALTFSWELTDGWKGFLFLQGLLLGVLYIVVACFTCGIGVPVALGVAMTVQAVTYNAILSDADASGRLSA